MITTASTSQNQGITGQKKERHEVCFQKKNLSII